MISSIYGAIKRKKGYLAMKNLIENLGKKAIFHHSSIRQISSKFHLDSGFIKEYENEKPPFGFNGLGELVYNRTYSRFLPSGEKEQWHQTLERVINGTYSLRKKWMRNIGLNFDDRSMQNEAQEMYERCFFMKILPPGSFPNFCLITSSLFSHFELNLPIFS